MRYCHICEGEYSDDFSICVHCELPLYDEPPPEYRASVELQSMVFLCSVSTEHESLILQGLLKGAGIPSREQKHSTGNYLKSYMEAAVQQVDLYVPEVLMEEARALVESVEIPVEALSLEERRALEADLVEDPANERNQVKKPSLKNTLGVPGLIGIIVIALAGLFVLSRVLTGILN